MSTTKVIEVERSTGDIVAGNIRAEAARMGFSQSALGRALGMSQNQITTRWRGVARWQLDELDAVAAILGVTVADLVTEPDSRPRGTRTPNLRIGGPRLDPTSWVPAA